MEGALSVGLLFRNFRGRILVTWLLVLLENILWALVPLFIGRAIDALLERRPSGLWEVAAILSALIVVATARRFYDTRCYGTIRVRFGGELVRRSQDAPVSRLNARLGMSREMVDFLEGHVPGVLTGVVQLLVSIAVLFGFDRRLGLAALGALAAIVLTYALFHGRFYRLNGELNAQTELQVSILEQRRLESLVGHLRKLRRSEVRLSDTEAVLYGGIFAAMFAFVLGNVWIAATIPMITAGAIFAILSYSWEFVESSIALPIALQEWSRLGEIRDRLNRATEDGEGVG